MSRGLNWVSEAILNDKKNTGKASAVCALCQTATYVLVFDGMTMGICDIHIKQHEATLLFSAPGGNHCTKVGDKGHFCTVRQQRECM